MTRRLRRAPLWPWVAAASLLHGFLSLLPHQMLPTAASSTPVDEKPAQGELEVVLLDEKSAASPSATSVVFPPLSAPPNTPSLTNSNTHVGTNSERGAIESVSRLPGPRNSGPVSEAAQPASRDVKTPLPESVSDLAQPGDHGTPAPNVTAVAQAPRQPQAAPRPLADLGYGSPHPAAVAPYLGVDATANAQNRLDQNLAQAIIDRDRDRSIGIEGPITQALHTAAMAVVVPTSLSKISVIIGSDGKLADFHIISTNQDARALAKLSDRLKKLLANKSVRVPNGRAVEFTYEIKSAVLLPSGRGPGLGVEVLGIPLSEGRSDNSSKISILTPKFKFGPVSEPDPERNGKVTQTLPQLAVGISVLGLDADLVDLGATERQVVHTRLIRQRVL